MSARGVGGRDVVEAMELFDVVTRLLVGEGGHAQGLGDEPDLEPARAVALALGLPASLALAGFCIVAAVLFHANLATVNEVLHFEKDLAIAGGMFVLIACGAGRWSADRRWRQRPA